MGGFSNRRLLNDVASHRIRMTEGTQRECAAFGEVECLLKFGVGFPIHPFLVKLKRLPSASWQRSNRRVPYINYRLAMADDVSAIFRR